MSSWDSYQIILELEFYVNFCMSVVQKFVCVKALIDQIFDLCKKLTNPNVLYRVIDNDRNLFLTLEYAFNHWSIRLRGPSKLTGWPVWYVHMISKISLTCKASPSHSKPLSAVTDNRFQVPHSLKLSNVATLVIIKPLELDTLRAGPCEILTPLYLIHSR